MEYLNYPTQAICFTNHIFYKNFEGQKVEAVYGSTKMEEVNHNRALEV